MVLVAGRAAVEVRVHARDLLIRGGAGELELDVPVELAEALLARQLRTGRAKESLDEGGFRHELSSMSAPAPRPRVASARRSLRRASWTVL